MNTPSRAGRRAWLQRSAAVALAGRAAPWAASLATLAEAAAAQRPADAKALVCVFLHGGNDHANTVLPYDDEGHAAYRALRGEVALPRDALDATRLGTVPQAEGRELALAPSLAPLMPAFAAGRLGVLLNVGPLRRPTTVAEFRAGRALLPPKLFSHNDQQSVWQSAAAEGATHGWGGRLADAFVGEGRSMFGCINLAGNAVFLCGREAMPYQLAPSGPVGVRGLASPLFGSAACSDALRALMTGPQAHPLAAHVAATARRSLEAHATLTQALAGVPTPDGFDEGSALARQLRMVVRMLGAREALGVRRQVFLVSLGGFDTHDGLTERHPRLLAEVGRALAAFDAALQRAGLGDRVTTFTASDFGRTLVANGDGSDHGWGGHHVVLGGAVAGGRCFGRWPALASNGPDDVGQGRLLPTTAVDQLAAELALWMGVPATDLPRMLPAIGAFDVGRLGLFGA